MADAPGKNCNFMQNMPGYNIEIFNSGVISLDDKFHDLAKNIFNGLDEVGVTGPNLAQLRTSKFINALKTISKDNDHGLVDGFLSEIQGANIKFVMSPTAKTQAEYL